MVIKKSLKLKCEVSAENTRKIMECLEEEFNKISDRVELDDLDADAFAVKAGLNGMHKTDAKIQLKEGNDKQSYTIDVSANYKLSIVFWISAVISLLVFIPLLLADVGIIFYNKAQLEKLFDNTLNSIKDEVC